MSDNDDLLPDFLAEASDIVEKIYLDLDRALTIEDKTDVVAAIFRNVHTLKGSSSMFNFVNTKNIAHELETYLASFKTSPQSLDEKVIAFLREEVQKIEELLKSKDRLDLKPGTRSAPVPTEETLPESKKTDEKKPAVAPASAGPVNADNFIRVPVNRVNETMNGVSEVFLIRNQMVYLVERYKTGEIGQRDFFQTWDILDSSLRRGVGDLERSTMSMRMTSVQGLFSRMARVVQSYSANGGKKIHFKTSGESTELDKKVLDTLGEPLIHLVRNAMDHGIESPHDRLAANKPEIGTITLTAHISGNEAVIQVTDDGKGIDPKKVLVSAQKKGLDVSHVTNDQSAIDLIFLPGFSTADAVSEVSGRGVGMDAVKTSVTELGGKVLTTTEVGSGSKFTIRIPVSMSLAPVVLVDIKGLKYAIPTKDILETRRTALSEMKLNAGQAYVTFKNKFIDCVDLREFIESETKEHEENIRECSLVFFNHGTRTVAARVSNFERNTEIVVRPLSSLAPKVSWVYGVSVLPTGESIFVLSLPKIIECRETKYAA